MTEETGWFEQATPAPPADSAGLPGTGPVAEPAPGPGPGTDVPGAAAAEPEPAAAEPAEHAAAAEDDQTAAEVGGAEPEPEPEQHVAVSPTAAAAADWSSSLPFIPAEGVPGWLRDILTELHRRLSNLEG